MTVTAPLPDSPILSAIPPTSACHRCPRLKSEHICVKNGQPKEGWPFLFRLDKLPQELLLRVRQRPLYIRLLAGGTAVPRNGNNLRATEIRWALAIRLQQDCRIAINRSRSHSASIRRRGIAIKAGYPEEEFRVLDVLLRAVGHRAVKVCRGFSRHSRRHRLPHIIGTTRRRRPAEVRSTGLRNQPILDCEVAGLGRAGVAENINRVRRA